MSNSLIPKSIDIIIENVLGPTSKEIGQDINTLYKKGRDLIFLKAFRKLKNPKDRGKANLRVARDVFWNGSFTDEAICAEYFGGILASSRSIDGKDDSGVFYVDIIKSMSSGQLRMHYIIYRTLNKELIANNRKKTLNPGQETELNREELFFPLLDIIEQFGGEDFGMILHGLHAKDLIGDFQTDKYELKDGKTMPYLKVRPKSLGIQLFAIANNRFSDWRNFPTVDWGDFEGVILPKFFAQSLDLLLDKIGLKKKDFKNQKSKN